MFRKITLDDGFVRKYDAACKSVLSQKMILAWIMKECMAEFEGYSAEQIARRFIETDPLVSQIAVYVENDGWLPKIQGDSVEDSSIEEGRITYDIRFTAIAPVTGRRIWIDVEPQKDFRPGYSLLKRGIYYLARMISSQRGREFTGSDYDNLKKAYSVWICMKPPKKWENEIQYYEFRKREDGTDSIDGPEHYDLMTQVILCLGDPRDPQAKGALRLLSVILNDVHSVEEKEEILEREFGIIITDTMRKGLDSMCNLGQGIFERGIECGIERGIERGIEKGIGTLNQLYAQLISKGLYEELERATKDDTYLEALMSEYGFNMH